MSATSVAEIVRIRIADTLSLELEEVVPDARWYADLNGESIDLLDLSFQLEKHYQIRLEFGRLVANDIMETDAAGVVLPQSIERLAREFPFVPIDRLPPRPKRDDMRSLLTVQSITRLVEREVAARGVTK